MSETIGEFCTRMGMDNVKQECATTESERARSALNDEIDALRAEAARYRAALEEIREKAAQEPEKFTPSQDIISFYDVNVIDPIVAIADRALNGEAER